MIVNKQRRLSGPILAVVTIFVLLLGVNNSLYGDDLDATANEVALQLRKGDERARQAVETFVKEGDSDPKKRDMIGVAALIYLKAGLYELSAQTYEKALRFLPNKAVYCADMALAYDRLGKLDKALTAGERSVELDPNDPLNKLNLARYNIERHDIKNGLDLATQALTLAKQRSDTDTAMQAQIMLVLVQNLDRYSQREIAQVREGLLNDVATAKVQGNEEAVQKGMDSLRLVEAFDKSTAQKHQKAVSAAPTKVPPSLVQKRSPAPVATNSATHVIKLRNGNVIEGTVTRQNDQEVTVEVPQAGQVVFTRAEIASIETRGDDSANSATAQAGDVRVKRAKLPNSAVLMAEVADHPTGLGNAHEPVVVLLRQVEGVDFSYVIPVSVALSAANKLETNGEIDQAIDVHEAILKAEPDNLFATERLKALRPTGHQPMSAPTGESPALTDSTNRAKELVQQALAELGTLDIEGAEAKLHQALELDPKSAEAHFQLSTIYSIHQDTAKVVAELEKAVALDSDSPLYLYQLGLQYAAINQLKRAKETIRKALDQPDRPGRPSVDRGPMTLAPRLFELLDATVGKAPPDSASSGQKSFEGAWRVRTTELVRIDLPGRSTEEIEQRKHTLQGTLIGEEKVLQLKQDGQLLHSPGRIGFVTDRWFACGERLQGDTPEGCIVTQLILFSGEMSDTGTLQGKEIFESSPDHPDKCPGVTATLETRFTGARQATP